MILRNSPLRRTASIAAGTLLGLTGVAFLAGPASAHHTTLKPSDACVNEDGTWQVTWTAFNSQNNLEAKLTDVKLTEGSTITGILKDAVEPKAPGSLEGVQQLPASAQKAELAITAFWDYQDREDVTKGDSGSETKPTEKCAPEEGAPVPSASASEPAPESPAPSASTPTKPAPSQPATPTTSPSASTPASSEPSAPAEEPEFVYEADCDSVTLGITVPKDWPKAVKVTFETSTGVTKTITGKVGETTKVELPATDGMEITATPEGYEDEAATITYEQPEDCDTAGSGGGDSDEPTLPLTGAAAGSIAVGAVVLLGAGIALFVVARRRKVKFTA
ncbi:LPXTG cell wall anchor domain-containing protein [Symbioplanes lichenis]|uniref:LPXTG cell wall anchor domain-containing protein n=1 Tax=Symbioplanes lichenis TaxID=1629072 RepID=UPI0027385784|nr:LPXTG cell wall anchor domain-containing protein [Actinoplanes lichenis]